ncbi:MAG: phosphate ABC transporter substrate-binding/OmpA family protein [Litoreibacter sp.]
MLLKKETRQLLWRIGASAGFGLTATIVHADTITLISQDQSMEISGDFKGFSEGSYIIDVADLGILRVRADLVECIGESCPFQKQDPNVEIIFDEIAPEVVESEAEEGTDNPITFAGSELLSNRLVPSLLAKFSQSKGMSTADVGDLDGRQNINMTEIGDENAVRASFQVASTSSRGAFEALSDPATNFGLSTRPIEADEARDLRDTNAGNLNNSRQQHILGTDNLAISINPANDVNTISLPDIARIYSGEITNWQDIGGRDAPIVIYSRDSNSGAQYSFLQQVMEPAGREVTPSVNVLDTNEAMAESILSDVNGIGYVSAATVENVKPVSLEMSCGISYFPTDFAAKTNEFPLRNQLYLYNRDDNLNETATDFIDFVGSSEIDNLVTDAGFVNLSVSASPQDIQTSRVRFLLEDATRPEEFVAARNLLIDMLDWERLSTTFRFSSGSARLDAQGRNELARLVQFMKEQPQGVEIAVVGFTDTDGAFGPNLGLSTSRAARVAEQISNDFSDLDITVKGYGELSPVACNDSVNGKRLNRRVEVWIRHQS